MHSPVSLFRKLALILCGLALSGVSARAAAAAAPADVARDSGASMFGAGASSPIVLADRRVTFNLTAPSARKVQLTSPDFNLSGGTIEFVNLGPEFKNDGQGNWTVTVGPLNPGLFRYTFLVDGVSTVDLRNPDAAEDLSGVESILRVPGTDFMDIKNVPHGTVSQVWYYSTTLGRTRRMTVYTPPGYNVGTGKLPVFYLLHGAGGSDGAWVTVGNANFIFDNLIAAKKAVPLIVVMPDGHLGSTFDAAQMGKDAFGEDFLKDIVPYVEKNYRVTANRANRAIAGLSMGGAQTLSISLPHLDLFSAIGVFSSGLFNGPGDPMIKANAAALDNPALKKGLKLFWTAIGKNDPIAMPGNDAMLKVLKEHGFKVDSHTTDGAHDWVNWQKYLNEFAPQLFR
ncbi:MAG: Carbohydrate acetyl esterase/feruloyl esterase precursor [Verrucomicrobiota bacterium]|jgi:enterochelin esterase family protein